MSQTNKESNEVNNDTTKRTERLNSVTYSSATSTESEGPMIKVINTLSDSDGDNNQLNCNNLDPRLLLTASEEYTSESGCENEASEVLSPELKTAIINCLEEYFDDESLLKDLFLLKHVKRRKDGFVSLKLMSSYKKIKKLTKSWRLVSAAAKSSDMLEVDETGRKVRRRKPLPDALKFDVPSSRILIAVDLTPELVNMEGLANVFGAFGPVASLQVVRPRPGAGIPPILQGVLDRFPQITKTINAVIEYEDAWGAGRALREFSSDTVTLHVLKQPTRRRSSASSIGCPGTPRSPRTRMKNKNSDKSKRTESSDNVEETTGSDEAENDSRTSSRLSWRKNSLLSPPSSPRMPSSPKKKFYNSNVPCSPVHGVKSERINNLKGITREPKGPDGTKGFNRRQSK